jgi:hypothetical protein
MKGRDIEATLKLVAVIIHLCSLQFAPKAAQEAEGSSVSSVAKVAALAGAGKRALPGAASGWAP